ncbi:MAG: hypothetical protein ACOC33_03895 [bacterium]
MKKLIVFDFDQTLFSTPEPEDGKKIWKEKTGEEYPQNKGWWGRPESLDNEMFDIKPLPNIYSKFKKDVSNPNNYVIILTARQEKLRPQVEKILNDNNIKPDELIMRSGNKDKGDIILDFVKENPDLKSITVYDDFAGGMKHKIKEFMDIKNKLPEDIEYNIFGVKNDEINIFETTNYLLSIITEEIIKLKG